MASAPADLVCEWVPAAQWQASFRARWADLARRAVEPNVFSCPGFVLPAVTHLTPDADVVAATVSATDGRFVALACFERRGPSWRLPFRHLQLYQSPHTFLATALWDGEHAEALPALWAAIRAAGYGAVIMRQAPAEGRQADAWEAAANQTNFLWYERQTIARAAVHPAEIPPDFPEGFLSRKRRKDIRSKWRALEELGAVDFHTSPELTLLDPAERAAYLDRFLELEAKGWKGEAGSALLSQPHQQAFIRAAVEELLADGQAVVFTELRVAGTAIASSLSLGHGNHAYAFKIGWDPAYAKQSVGMLHEVEIVRHAAAIFPKATLLDGCAEAGSFLEPLFPTRRGVRTGIYAARGWPQRWLQVLMRLRTWRR